VVVTVTHLLCDEAPQPIAPFSHATLAGPWVFVTGQMPIEPATGAYVRGTFAEQTDVVMRNLALVLTAAGSDWAHVLHARIYLTDFTRYAEVNAAYARWFPAGKLPARTCIGVTALAGGADVEIDLLAVRREAS
jgi:2-iminobutanoate/2-iminopropanoate deaminase